MMRSPLTWLVFDVVPGSTVLAGEPQFVIGRAELVPPDTIVVTTRRGGRIEGTIPRYGDPEKAARVLLRELHRTTAR